MIRILSGFFVLWGALFLMPIRAHADSNYVFSCPESSIKGGIPYSVIGMYSSIYKECSGKIIFDDQSRQIKSVNFNIKTSSIESNCKWCDEIVRSNKVLDVTKYPAINFKSINLENKDGISWVQGSFDLHGVTRNMRSSFEFTEDKNNTLLVSGVWKINRKDFNIIWNKLLDHGGILVGDFITVNWQVKAYKV